MKAKGKFIVFEALDGAGKTTQVDMLVNRLAANGVPVWKTKECTDGPIGKILKEYYLSGNRICDEATINILMAADRLEHVTGPDGILAHLNEGEWVVCDRFVLSGFAYSNYMHDNKIDLNEGFEATYYMNKQSIELVKPDLTFFLDVPLETCIERLINRHGIKEVYEDAYKLRLIRKTYGEARIYLTQQKKYCMNIFDMDGSPDPEMVADSIYYKVEQQLL